MNPGSSQTTSSASFRTEITDDYQYIFHIHGLQRMNTNDFDDTNDFYDTNDFDDTNDFASHQYEDDICDSE